MAKASVAAGKNVKGTQGSPKKWSELLSKCEKSEKKSVLWSDRAAGKCFERSRYMAVWNLIHFYDICRRLEVVGVRKNMRARGRHACPSRAPVLTYAHLILPSACEFSDLILLKKNVSLEISSDFKHCLGSEVGSIVEGGCIVKSQCFYKHFTGVTHIASYQRISRKIIIETSPERLMFVPKW